MKKFYQSIFIYLFCIVCCVAQETRQNIHIESNNVHLMPSMKRVDHNNLNWRSNFTFDSQTGFIFLSVTCLSDAPIQIDVNKLFKEFTFTDSINIDTGFDIKIHHDNKKMDLVELMEYFKSIEPVEEKLSEINGRDIMMFFEHRYPTISQTKKLHRFIQLKKNESISRVWRINHLFKWSQIYDFLKQHPDSKFDLTKFVSIQRHDDTQEYMLKRCLITYAVLKNINNDLSVPLESNELASIKINKFYGTIHVTITNLEQKILCYNLDDMLGKNNNEFGKRFHFTTLAEFENIKTKKNTDFFNIKNPFPEDELQRIVCLEKDECITKTIKITDLPILKQLQSTMQKNKEEEYIIWFPICYKKNEQIIIDFASLKVNYKSIFD
ncbi:MAG: hypothetical protein LBC20_00030 [Planctomycetaceae bacterium]|jgi:hypothetical protein|nr:hypothetical protein [Planctomycetaceae bacterium]